MPFALRLMRLPFRWIGPCLRFLQGPLVSLVNNADAHGATRSSLSLTEFGACMRLNAPAVLLQAVRHIPALGNPVTA
jgi:hypothetical protein